MTHPYESLPAQAYWRTGVADVTPFTLENFYKKRFSIEKTDKIATAGSCFAQHVARHMKKRGFKIVDVEPPLPSMSVPLAQKYGFSTYSARYGNIYTIRQFRQLIDDSLGRNSEQPEGNKGPEIRESDIMERNGRFYDGLRPNIEPSGLPTMQDVRDMRSGHLRQVKKMLRQMDVLVFTFGLTETWENTDTGTVYPICPGVIAGTFDSEKYRFLNLTYEDCIKDFKAVYRTLMRMNANLRILVTVSPVPLTATASGNHVLSATTYSKSVLRAVCGDLVSAHDNIDYFPSYEIISAPMTKGQFFEENMRSVAEAGVETVMKHLFVEHDPLADPDTEVAAENLRKQARRERRRARKMEQDVVCEEVLLDAFSPKVE